MRCAQDPGAIQQWLVLAPIVFEGRNGSAALEQEQVPQEGSLRPRVGEQVKLDQTGRFWNVVHLPDSEFPPARLLAQSKVLLHRRGVSPASGDLDIFL